MRTNGSVGRYVDLSGINFDADDIHNYFVRSSSSIKSSVNFWVPVGYQSKFSFDCVFEEDVQSPQSRYLFSFGKKLELYETHHRRNETHRTIFDLMQMWVVFYHAVLLCSGRDIAFQESLRYHVQKPPFFLSQDNTRVLQRPLMAEHY